MSKVQRIAAVGFRHVLAFARRCRDLGVEVHLIDVRNQADGPRSFPSWIHSEGATALTWAEIGTDPAMERIRRFVTSIGAEALISADELTLCWLARHRDLFEPQCRVLAPPADLLERVLSKQAQMKIAGEAGFPLLKTWVLAGASDGMEIPSEQFPICVRPTYPISVRPPFKAKVLGNRPEMTAWLQSLEYLSKPLVAQPFRVGPNIIVHGARDLMGKMLALTGYRTVRKFQGFAQSLERFDLGGELEACCRKFVELAGLVGPFHFDLLHSDAEKRTYFLEVNTRLGGSTGKVVGLGYDEPALALEAFGLATPTHRPLPRGRRRVTSKRSLLKQMAVTLRPGQPDDFRYPVEGRPETLLHSFIELACVSDPTLSIHDMEGSALHLFRPDN